MHFSKISLLAAAASTADAFLKDTRTFAVNHFFGKGPLTQGRMDPIVNPGGPSGHVHVIQGGNAFNVSMTDTQPLESTCTSSRINNDKSNYWVPTLYFKDPKTGQLESVDLFYANIYYFFEPTDDKIVAFPPGLRMVVGDPALRSPPSSGGNLNLDLGNGKPIQPVQWTCPRKNNDSPLYPADSDGLHGVGIGDTGNKGAGTGFPDRDCDGFASPLRADIHFPSCINPKADVRDYKNNAVYPTNSNCPKDWIHVPALFYEFYFDATKFKERWTQGEGNQPFVLSNGDPTGYSLHADFLNGWDPKTLQTIIDTCDAGSSGMENCPNIIGGVADDTKSCNIEAYNPSEVISGVMSALPGNNPITEWGSGAAAVVDGVASVIGGAVSSVVNHGAAPATSAMSSPATSTPVAASPAENGSPSTPATGSSPATTSSSTPSTGGGDAVAAGWKFKGCFQDADQKDRVLNGVLFANTGKVSNTNCVDYCSKKGFSMAGTEYGGQCFCGNELKTTTLLPDDKCSMPCEGAADETCGGSLALSVYSTNGKRRRHRRHLSQVFGHFT